MNGYYITNGMQPGSSNFIGNSAGSGAGGASSSNFIGNSAGNSASSASYSNFLGVDAGHGATGATYSNFLGSSTGLSASNAYDSNFLGALSGFGATNAYNSNFMGFNAGRGATNAANSIFIGYYAGYQDTVTNTSNPNGTSIAIGNYSGTGGYSNSVAIGHGVTNSTTTQMNLGNVININGIYNSDTQSSAFVTGATVNLGSNALTTTGKGSFGTFQLGTSTTSGYVLTADASGNGNGRRHRLTAKSRTLGQLTDTDLGLTI